MIKLGSGETARHITLLTSYPRSGNTWVRVMLASYLADAPVISRDRLENLVPDFHFLLANGRLYPAEGSHPLVVKTHFLPSAEVLQPYRPLTTRVIYLVRDPQDVIISARRFLRIGKGQEREFAREFIANRGVTSWRERAWGTWPGHVLGWTSLTRARQHLPNLEEVLPVRYEDLKGDPAGMLRHILEFLGLGGVVEPKRVQRAVESSSLERMRAAELAAGGKGDGSHDAFHRVGEGRHGQSLALLGEDVEAAYQRLLRDDEEFSHCVKRFGYE